MARAGGGPPGPPAVGRMGPRNAERVDACKRLREVAARLGVARAADNAGRQKVGAMREAILAASDLSDAERPEVEAAWAAYLSTFAEQEAGDSAAAPGGAGAGADSGPAQGGRAWKFQAAQLTYNCKVGDWASEDDAVLRALFDRFVVFLQSVGVGLQAKGLSATMEDSTKAGHHVHIHAYLHLEKQYRREGSDALAEFVFEGIRPHCEPNTARGPAYKGAVKMGHYYVVIQKIGSRFEWTDFPPFQAYGVEPWWLDNWMKAGKLTRATYLSIAARCGIGFQRRLADVRAAERYEREQAVDEQVKAESAALTDSVLQAKEFPEVDQFLDLFKPDRRLMRRPMLVIIGGTNLGKSVLGASVLRRLAVALGVPGYMEVTVEGSPHLDLGDFDHRAHSGVLLDGVGDAMFLKAHREVLQGRPKKCKGGQSATNVYAFSYCLARRGVVATLDLSAKNLDAFRKDHWMSERRNIIVLNLTDKAYVDPSAAPLPDVAAAASNRTEHSSPVVRPPAKRRPVGSPAGLPPVPAMPGFG